MVEGCGLLLFLEFVLLIEEVVHIVPLRVVAGEVLGRQGLAVGAEDACGRATAVHVVVETMVTTH